MSAEDVTWLQRPGWTVDELRQTLQATVGPGADYTLDHATRFVRGVATVVRRRTAMDESRQDPRQLSVFLLHPTTEPEAGLAHEPMLDNGLTPIAGKIWFVNAPVLSGFMRDLETEDAAGVFRLIVEDLGLRDVAAVVVDPRLPTIGVRYYPNGLGDPDSCINVRLHGSNVELQDVCEVIERAYTRCLITPDAQATANRLWADTSKSRPFRDAEHRIQAALYHFFSDAFPTCKVFDEFKGTTGRADLHVVEHDPLDHDKVTYLIVLELKVLRSRGEGGASYSEAENLTWVDQGVKQAGAYRQEHGHRVAALCCFDMRDNDSGDECFAHVRKLASRLNVALRRWYLYSNSERWRDKLAEMPIGPQD